MESSERNPLKDEAVSYIGIWQQLCHKPQVIWQFYMDNVSKTLTLYRFLCDNIIQS